MKRILLALLLAALALPALPVQPSLNVYFQTTLKDAAYQKAVFQKVAGTWKSPAKLPAAGKKCVVQAVIDKSGKLVSATVSMTSGVKAWDEAAQAAVTSASPFAPLPAGYAHKSLEAHFHFAVVP